MAEEVEEVEEVVGPKGKHNADRTAVRHGHETGEVTLGGRRVQVERPRVRTADGGAEVGLDTYGWLPRRTVKWEFGPRAPAGEDRGRPPRDARL